MVHVQPYHSAGPRSTTGAQPSEPEESFEEWISRTRREKSRASFDALIEHIEALPPEAPSIRPPLVPVDPAEGGADRGAVPPPPPAEYFTMPGLAPGLVIKSINGKNEPLPRSHREWKRADKQGFLESNPLANKGKSHLKTSVVLLHNDVKVKHRIANSEVDAKRAQSKRGRVLELSRKSKAHMVETARNVTGLVAMLTLTYPAEFPCDGKLVKKHLELIRKWLLYRGIGAFWFLEFQKRGAPHFHLFTNGTVDIQDLSRAWFKIVGSGDEKHLWAGTSVEMIRKPHAIATYAAKYAAKADQKLVPAGYESVGRFWGNFGGVKVVPVDQETGTPQQVAPLVRVIRKLENARRKSLGLPPRKQKGNGRVGFTSFGTSAAIQYYLQRTVPF